jgi:Flp pilus assembly protein CpaB
MKHLAVIVAALLLSGIAPLAGACVKQNACCNPQKSDCCKVQATSHNDATTVQTVVVAQSNVTFTAAIFIDAPPLFVDRNEVHASPPTQRRLASLSTLLI